MKCIKIILIICLIGIHKISLCPELNFIQERENINIDERIKKYIEYNRFTKDLGFAESTNIWDTTNTIGALGEWQFMWAAREITGYGHITYQEFKDNPEIWPRKEQKFAMDSLIKINEKSLKRQIKKYGNKSGILAAAHIAGPEGVKGYFKKGYNPADKNGTRLTDYLNKFKGYEF